MSQYDISQLGYDPAADRNGGLLSGFTVIDITRSNPWRRINRSDPREEDLTFMVSGPEIFATNPELDESF